MQFRPRKTAVVTEIRLERSDEVDQIVNEADLDTLEYSTRYGRYRFRIDKVDLEGKRDALAQLIRMAFAR